MSDRIYGRKYKEGIDYLIFSSGCWAWNHILTADGYGKVRYQINGIWKSMTAHRYFYIVYKNGNINLPTEVHVDHLCRNRWCVNPEHTKEKTLEENVLAGEGLTAQNARKEKCSCGRDFKERKRIGRRNSRYCSYCQYQKANDSC